MQLRPVCECIMAEEYSATIHKDGRQDCIGGGARIILLWVPCFQLLRIGKIYKVWIYPLEFDSVACANEI